VHVRDRAIAENDQDRGPRNSATTFMKRCPGTASGFSDRWPAARVRSAAALRSRSAVTGPGFSDPTARYQDLGADYHTSRIDAERRTRNHVRQLARSATTSPSPPRPNSNRT
jgi:hypothetical protein